MPTLAANARWAMNGVTVAGGKGGGNATNQLSGPYDLCIDDDQTVIIADMNNHRIIQWKKDATTGEILVGAKGPGARLDQLNSPRDVLIDKETDSLIIADTGNRRVVRWSLRSTPTPEEILLDDIACSSLAMDDQGYLYIFDREKYEVKRYRMGDNKGTLVAGGNGAGAALNQLQSTIFLFVDREQTVYVSDKSNHRVMKWIKDAKEGTVVVGGQGSGLKQLTNPNGLFVDSLGTLYVADMENQRVISWPKGAKQGTVIVGANGQGAGTNQLCYPRGLSFDRHGNLYVVDQCNHRVQRYSLE
jgi:sugar lactone lactonase YvrE